jgi:hypothetical protein
MTAQNYFRKRSNIDYQTNELHQRRAMLFSNWPELLVLFYNNPPFVISQKSVHAARALQRRPPRRADGFRQNDKKERSEGH